MGQLHISVKECSTSELLMTSPLVASLYIEKIGEKVLHWQPQVICSGFFYSDVSAPGSC